MRTCLLVLLLSLLGPTTFAQGGGGYRAGLVAHYYKDTPFWGGNWTATHKPETDARRWTFGKYCYTRVEPMINHQFDRQGWFSVRWVGYLDTASRIFPDRVGEYEFRLWAQDGCRLYIDGKKVIDSWQPSDAEKADSRRRAKIKLRPGKHRIVVEYFLGLNGKYGKRFPMKLYWKCNIRGMPERIVPAKHFFHSITDLPPKPGMKD